MDINLLVSSVNGAAQTIRTFVDLRDANKIAAVKADLTKSILEAQAQLSEVLGAIVEKNALINTLQERVLQLEARQHQRDRYKLGKLPLGGDAIAYGLKPSAELSEYSDEPPQFVCQLCMDGDSVKSVLQENRWDTGWRYFCARCGWTCNKGNVSKTVIA